MVPRLIENAGANGPVAVETTSITKSDPTLAPNSPVPMRKFLKFSSAPRRYFSCGSESA